LTTGSPAPTAPALASIRPSPPSAKATPSSSPNSSGIKLSLGGQVYDPTDPMGKMFFNILATFAEFEVGLLRMRTREGMAVARAKGQTSRQATQALTQATARTRPHGRHR
jgi:Resolvase, N terminal domain